jgi:hypothetical protein
MWLSSHLYISELLDEWNLSTCKPTSTPFPSQFTELPPAPPNSLPDISDDDLISKYQRIVGCLLYLAVTTRPDLSYYAVWLGQFNSKPTLNPNPFKLRLIFSNSDLFEPHNHLT